MAVEAIRAATVGLDFEFYGSEEARQTVICAAISVGKSEHYKYWLEDGSDLGAFKQKMKDLKSQGAIFLAYAASAESRSLEALGMDPFDYNWVDLYVEFRMLCNSNNRWNYGEYIGDDGSIKFSRPPLVEEIGFEDELEDEEEKEAFKAGTSAIPKNLVNAAYKLLGVRLDALEKEEMRQLVLSRDHVRMRSCKEQLLNYCLSDTKYLRALDIAIQEAYKELGMSNFREEQLLRGRYVVATGKCESLGIPLNMDLLNRIIEKTPEMLASSREKVNLLFPEGYPMFTQEIPTRTHKFKNGRVAIRKGKPAKRNMSSYYRLVESLNIPNFPRTESGKLSSSKKVLQDYRNHHPGLRELFLYNTIEANLKWFNAGNKDGFFERVGSDNRIRPYYGTFGTQTGRNAARAKTFPFAMSSWLRTIVQPPKGQFIVGADFSSQELYVAAKLSQDEEFLDAYNSGDFYIASGKKWGLIPPEGTKQTHATERNLICKPVVLGIQFGLGVAKMALTLAQTLSRVVTDDEAKSYIQMHKKTFKKYWDWIYRLSRQYTQGTPLTVADGWTLWTDNPIMTSVRNFPVQGTAAACTRLAVIMAWEAGLKVMCSLHDAIYILTDNPERDVPLLESIMIKATAIILQEPVEQCTIRVDSKVISHEEYFVEDKGKEKWEEFKPILLGDEFKKTA